MRKDETKSLELVKVKELPQTSGRFNLFSREVKYLKIKDVRRAYSKLIQDYCKGLVPNEDAKTVTYMFAGYLQLIREFETEQKLADLEERLNNAKLREAHTKT
jgi:hypothetical protein